MKKLIPILMSLLLVVSLFAGCGSKEAAAGLFKAGKYTGEGKGYAGSIKVEVEVSADKILNIVVLEHNETKGVSDPAFEKIPAQVIANQSIAVDVVSGATLASNGLIEAITNALVKTATDMEKLKKEITKTVSNDNVKKTADVVIIGSGGAGMSAAYEAKKAGASVIVIEKNASAGGNTILAGSALNAADPENQKQLTMKESELKAIKGFIELEPKNDIMKGWQEELASDIKEYEANGSTYLYDSPALHKLQTYVDGDYVGNPVLIDILGDGALDSINFLSGLGAKWSTAITAAVGATWTRSHTPTQDLGSAGASFVLPQEKAYKEMGGEIYLEHKAEELIVENGRVVGVKGSAANGSTFEFSANKGVIIATGGFGANVEMRQKYNTHWANLDETIQTTNGPFATGDGIVLAEAVGANLIGMEWIQMLPTGKIAFGPTINNTIFVNNKGERFIKEDARRDVLSAAVLEQPGSYYYKIVDAHTAEDELKGVTYKGLVIKDIVDGEYCVMGETVEDLATQLKMDPKVLQATIDDYNKAVESRVDEFGRAVFDQKIDKAPYYALHGVAKVHHTMGGIEINEKTQVIDKNGAIIPGLYAAGEVTGGIHGSNRLGGNAIADIITFGRIAGQEVVK